MKEKILSLLSSDFIVGSALPAALILAVAFLLGRQCGRLVRVLVRRIPRADETVEQLASGVASWLVWLVGILAALRALGIDTTGALAALGALAVAVGLGLKDTLGNVAAGIQIILLRPLAVGEYVSFRDPSDARSSGTVVHIGLFATQLRTFDGLHLAVPNRLLVHEPVLNYDRNPERMVRLVFSISYSDSIETGLRTLLRLGTDEPHRIPERPAEVFVEALSDSAVQLSLRVWVPKADFWPVRRALTEAGKLELEKAGLKIPFPQRDIHVFEASSK